MTNPDEVSEPLPEAGIGAEATSSEVGEIQATNIDAGLVPAVGYLPTQLSSRYIGAPTQLPANYVENQRPSQGW